MSAALNLNNDTWLALTDGTNNGWLSAAVGTLQIYIGATAPGAGDTGHPNNSKDVIIRSPAKAWYRRAPGASVVQVINSTW